jgi:hypothetical protein
LEPALIIIDFILEVIGYTTARLLLPLITLGSVQVQQSHQLKQATTG